VCITDEKSGLLRSIADQCGYKSYSIPSDIGGRYSVATPVGLLPMACAGLDIKQFVAGMSEVYTKFISGSYDEISEYVQWRIGSYGDGKSIECMANFSPRHSTLTLWRQQLFGESEWKQWQWLFPAVLQYSTDLHSMGQYVQDGVRLMIETLLFVDAGNDEMEKANDACRRGTKESHQSWWVPVYEWNMWTNTEYAVWKRMFQMMLGCAISCYLAEVNPFDQPGVEWYKSAMKRYMS
jgi:glucose-6-phosphate isomerase